MHANASDWEIQLTKSEKALVSQIDFKTSSKSHNADPERPSADAMEKLMRSLLKRNAIPEARWKYFSDPVFYIGGHELSHRQVFENNGTCGDAIYRHQHFVKYLRYFVYGPALPKSVIEDFQKTVIGCGKNFTSGDISTVSECARRLARSHDLKADKAEEFYKLALDCGLDASDACSVRDAVKKLR